MKFCMLTSFFGAHSFGGDSAYVDRLSRALARRGHEIHVIYCRDAFELVRGSFPDRDYTPPDGVSVHGLRSGLGPISPLWTQQTGRPGPKWRQIQRIVRDIEPDVVHAHNLSLIGGPGLLLKDFGKAVRLMTAHEHWLVCPMHVLWNSRDELCHKTDCHRCSIASGRPPQFWRETGLMEKGLNALDRLIVPSRTAAEEHRARGISRPIDILPYFLPDDWQFARKQTPSVHGNARPYFACVGRVEKIKGFQKVVELMDRLPGADLRIAGHGGYLDELKQTAAGRGNIQFEGMLEGEALRRFMRGARAVVVPSLVPETFGYVVLEAFAQGRPVLGRHLGALPEIIQKTGGGLIFQESRELLESLELYLRHPEVADLHGWAGREALDVFYSEEGHIRQYLGWIRESQGYPPEIQSKVLSDSESPENEELAA